MKRFAAIFLTCLVALSSCVKLDTPRPQSFSRTVLLYLACDGNGLQWYAEGDLANLVRGYLPIRTDKDEALLVFYDDGSENPALHRYYVTSEGLVYKELVKLYDNGFNSADTDNLKRVLDDVEYFYPSERRGLILWSHGTGWLPPGYYANPKEGRSVSKSFAQEAACEMDIRDLADVLTRHYEFILFDSCLMATVEVAYQLRDKTDYLIASCAEILVDGFPYSAIGQDFFYDHTGKGPAALQDICKQYYDFYNAQTGANRTATVSLIDCSKLDELAAVSRKIFAAHKADMPLVNPSAVQHYYTGNKHWFYDLTDYVKQFATESELSEFKAAMDRCVLSKYATEWILGVVQVRTHSGLSTYIPIENATYLNSYYKTLDWTQDTGAL
ncbi:MAG: hypothetical protein IKX11_05090 [Bacteroidales bacterium]|nr:hypothetical protein [Bacteroidales bacterium]